MVVWFAFIGCQEPLPEYTFTSSQGDLHTSQLPTVWDEAIPLGNGMVGALIWEKDRKLRMSLDRADLWDLRPMKNLNTQQWKYKWVKEQWEKNDYRPVQEKFDHPYDQNPAPSKIPGAALEFDLSVLGEIESTHLYLDQAVCEVKWKNGARLLTFVHATEPVGWFRFEGIDSMVAYELIPPAYTLAGKDDTENPVTGQDLRRLGYPEGKVVQDQGSFTYDQEGWGGFRYQVQVAGKISENVLEGCWSISAQNPGGANSVSAKEVIQTQLSIGMEAAYSTHLSWWENFWNASDVQVPDQVLQTQWRREQYKFGAAARSGAPPISLQAVWTADNGKLPPWKGDFHHDLNTQLSYWPAYSANHLGQAAGFTDWLWKYRGTFKQYTEEYFEAEGINVPGVSTLTGEPMGGWIQYSFGPTVSSWLGHHFYLQWRYTMDRTFLAERAYPWIKEVAIYLEDISEFDDAGKRKLPISSSPEIGNNSRDAWFGETTNFDLGLIRWTFEKAAELAQEMGDIKEAKRWQQILNEWPELAIDEKTGLLLAPGVPYTTSHRHLSHQIAYHPLGLLDFSKGAAHQQVIRNTLSTLEEVGTQEWVGYSFSWLGNMKARAFDGEGAAETLRIFASSFCLPNSFHVNGDQSGTGYSNFTYRPFTLEGNFAFAAGLQEMLIQSHSGAIHVFPAVPADWQDIRFDQLRTEGAFLVSATQTDGKVKQVEVASTAGGVLRLINPFQDTYFMCSMGYELQAGNLIVIQTQAGDRIQFSAE